MGGGWGLYTCHYTITTRMTCVLRRAAMRAILMFHKLQGTKSQDSVHRLQLLKRKESRSGFEPRPHRLPAYRLTARPNRFSLQGYEALYLLAATDITRYLTVGRMHGPTSRLLCTKIPQMEE